MQDVQMIGYELDFANHISETISSKNDPFFLFLHRKSNNF